MSVPSESLGTCCCQKMRIFITSCLTSGCYMCCGCSVFVLLMAETCFGNLWNLFGLWRLILHMFQIFFHFFQPTLYSYSSVLTCYPFSAPKNVSRSVFGKDGTLREGRPDGASQFFGSDGQRCQGGYRHATDWKISRISRIS